MTEISLAVSDASSSLSPPIAAASIDSAYDTSSIGIGVNVTHCRLAVDLLSFDVIVFGFLGTFINIVGLLGNILSLIVLIKEHKRSASFSYLIALTATAVVWIFIASWEWNLAFLSRTIKIQHKKFAPYQDYVRESNELANTWVLVAFCFERWQAVSAPLSFRAKSQGSHKRRSAFFLFLILLISYSVKIPRFFEYVFVDAKDSCDGNAGGAAAHATTGHISGASFLSGINDYNVTFYETEHSKLRQNKVYVWAYKIIFAYLTRFFVPLFLLFCFNLKIIDKIRSSAKFRRISAIAGNGAAVGRSISISVTAPACEGDVRNAAANVAAGAAATGNGLTKSRCNTAPEGLTIDYSPKTGRGAASSIGSPSSSCAQSASDVSNCDLDENGHQKERTKKVSFVGDSTEISAQIGLVCDGDAEKITDGITSGAADDADPDRLTIEGAMTTPQKLGADSTNLLNDGRNSKTPNSRSPSSSSLATKLRTPSPSLAAKLRTISTTSISSATPSVGGGSEAGGGSGSGSGWIRSTEHRVTLICVSTVTAFLVTSFPHFLLSLMRLAYPSLESSHEFLLARKFGIALTNLNCCLIFVIFFVLSPRYRTVFRRLFFRGVSPFCCGSGGGGGGGCCNRCGCCCCGSYSTTRGNESWIQSEMSSHSQRFIERRKKGRLPL